MNLQLTALLRKNQMRAGLCLFVFCLLHALAGCGPPKWDGQFTGTAEVRLEERSDLSESRETKDFAVKENFTVKASSEGERDKVLTFGECRLRFHSDKEPPGDTFQASPNQFCTFSFGHYVGDFEMTGAAVLNRNGQTGRDHLSLTLTGNSIETVPSSDKSKKLYSLSFQGER